MGTLSRPLAALLLLLPWSPVLAGDGDGFTLRPPNLSLSQPDEVDPVISAPPARDHALYGSENSQWLTFGALAAHDFSYATDLGVRFAWSQFLVQDVEFMLEGNLWYLDQRGDNAFGVNPAFAFRWHFVNEQPLSVYTELGIGMLFATSAVPEGGTDVDFMPRVGVGLTYELDEASGVRLDVGLRWHHISNARITGDAKNPSRDAVLIYGGIVVPF